MSTSSIVALPRVFTRAQASAAGIRPERPHGRPVVRLTHNVFSLDTPSPELMVEAASLALGPDSVMYGLTALRLYGVDLPRRLDDDKLVHVLRTEHVFAADRPSIQSHRGRLQLAPVVIASVSAAHPAEAWLQIANSLTLSELIHVGDALMRRQHPLTTIDELAIAVEQSHRRRGICRAREALTWCRASTDSWQETTTRVLLVGSGLPCPIVNLPIAADTGRVVYYLDMAYPDAKVAVEYDGSQHVGDAGAMQYDRRRTRWLEDRGWRIITITAADLYETPGSVVSSVRQALIAGGLAVGR